jgi:hypothetical protein
MLSSSVQPDVLYRNDVIASYKAVAQTEGAVRAFNTLPGHLGRMAYYECRRTASLVIRRSRIAP